MKKQFLFVILFLIFVIGGGIVFSNAKPLSSDSSNLALEVGKTYFIRGDGQGKYYEILILPDTSGWMKVRGGGGDYLMNTNSIFYMQESK